MAQIQDEYEILSQVVRTTEDVTYKEIRKLALTSNNGLTAAQLRERLNAIADMIRLRDGARRTLRHYVDGQMSTADAVAQLQGQLRELFGTPDQYSDCPDEDDLDPDPE
jgi:hypothetical protein